MDFSRFKAIFQPFRDVFSSPAPPAKLVASAVWRRLPPVLASYGSPEAGGEGKRRAEVWQEKEMSVGRREQKLTRQ